MVPKIDLTGFKHQILDRTLTFRNGELEAGGTPLADDRPPRDRKPPPSAAVIQEAIRTEKQCLQGTWTAVSGIAGGRSATSGQNTRLIIADDTIVLELPGRREAKYSLDPAKSPKRIDLVATSPDGKQTEHIRGVYELRGDDLYLCLAFGDEPRPTNTRASPGSKEASLVLRRQRP